MLSTALALSALAALACAVVYGTDVFVGLVLRPALAALDDSVLVQAAGRIHEYADQRMPLPGGVGTLAAAGATLTAGLGNHPLQTGLASGALVALLAWLVLYLRIAAPINRDSPTRPPPSDTRQRATTAETLGQHHRSAHRPADRRADAARQRARVHMRRARPTTQHVRTDQTGGIQHANTGTEHSR